MSIVVIGADYLGSIEKNLYSLGVKELKHIDGRKVSNQNKINIPKKTDFVLVLTDYVNHNTAKMVKAVAKIHDVPLIFFQKILGICGRKNKIIRNHGRIDIKISYNGVDYHVLEKLFTNTRN